MKQHFLRVCAALTKQARSFLDEICGGIKIYFQTCPLKNRILFQAVNYFDQTAALK